MPTITWRILTVLAFLFLAANQLRTALPAAGEQSPQPPPPHVSARDDEDEGDEVEEREAYFYNQRAAPNVSVPDFALIRARAQVAQVPPAVDRVRAQAVVETAWSSVGPQPIAFGETIYSGVLPNSGRVSAVAVVDANTAYIGAASGGVWKTTNGGTLWTPLTDTQASLAIGAIAVDPTNNSIVYAGLGEQNAPLGDSYYGAGILKSTNAGGTWTLLTAPQFDRQKVGRIAVDPNQHDTVYAATSAGIAKSTNGGATWTFEPLGCCIVSDVVIDATTNPSTVYAAQGYFYGDASNGVYKTTTNLANTAAGWTKLTGTAASPFPTTNLGRIRLAITQAAPVTLYAVVSQNYSAGSGLMGVWKSADGGATWTQTAHPETSSGVSGQSVCKQCNYNLDIAVYPTDPNVVYVLTVELFKSTNGGSNWSMVSSAFVSPYKIHVDQHAFGFVPGNSSSFYLGNDGGVYASTDAGANFVNLNRTLGVVQFYRGAAHPVLLGSAVGGTQDNGPLSYEANPDPTQAWWRVQSGDGGYAAVDFLNPSNVYYTTQDLEIWRTTTGPRGDLSPAVSGITPKASEPRQFVAPLVMDPTNSSTLYAGTTRLYRSTDRATTWTAVSPDLSSASDAFTATSAIGISRTASNTIYVGTGSSVTGSSRLWVTTNGGTNWSNQTGALPNRFVTSIAVHPADSRTAWVALSGFGVGHVWKTIDGGATWANSSGALPDAPVNAIVVDPADGNLLYIGTDVGVFKSTDGGASWAALNSGLPNVLIMDLVLNRAGTRLFAFTHGRGVWVSDRSQPPTPTPTFTPTVTRTPTVVLFPSNAAVVGWNYNYVPDPSNTAVIANGVKPLAGLTGITGVAASGAGSAEVHYLAVNDDSTVLAWGDNLNGELGDGTTTTRADPVQVKGPGCNGVLDDVIAVAAGQSHSMALKADGTVWSWGSFSVLASGLVEQTSAVVCPVKAANLDRIVAISAWGDHSLALRSDGTVWAWGRGDEVGHGAPGTPVSIHYEYVPVPVIGLGGQGQLQGITAISAGRPNLAIRGSDGQVIAWGLGFSGNGDSSAFFTPVQVGGMTGAASANGSLNSSFVVKQDGTVWAWGNVLGTTRQTPVQVPGLAGVASVQGGPNAITALIGGAVWQVNSACQFGADCSRVGTTVTNTLTGQQSFSQLTGVSIIAAGNGSPIALRGTAPPTPTVGPFITPTAIPSQSPSPTSTPGLGPPAGNVLAWGNNATTPVPQFGLSPAISVASSDSLGRLAVKPDGSVWKANVFGTTTLVPGPDGSAPFDSAVVVAAGPNASHALLLKADGTVWAWGSNGSGQLGDGTITSRQFPVQVRGPGGVGFLTGVISIATGSTHSLAVRNDGTVWAWGDNRYSQLGDGTHTNRTVPVQVLGLTGAASAAGGTYHSVAARTDGSTLGWGYGEFGNAEWLGDGSAAPLVAVAAGIQHSLGLRADGTVWAWGDNSFGQLGQDNTTLTVHPVQVKRLSDVSAIAAGAQFSLALTHGGVCGWGVNSAGQLGNGTRTDSGLPVQVPGLGGVTGIAAGTNGSIAIQILPFDAPPTDCLVLPQSPTPTFPPTATRTPTETAVPTRTPGGAAPPTPTPTISPTPSGPTPTATPLSGTPTGFATLNGTVTLQGLTPGTSAYEVQLEVRFFAPGGTAPLAIAQATTDVNGSFSVVGIIPGTYDVEVKEAKRLGRIARGMALPGGATTRAFGDLLAGDTNGDDAVTLVDYSRMRASFSKCQGDSGYQPLADFNGDNCVSLPDYSRLRANFGMVGPLNAP